MRIDYKIEQSAPRKRKVITDAEKEFTDYFWNVVGAVRQGKYTVRNSNSVVEQVDEERRLSNL